MALYEIEKNSSGVPTGNYKYVAGRVNSEKINEMYEAFPSDASASNKLVTESELNQIAESENTYLKATFSKSGRNIIANIVAKQALAQGVDYALDIPNGFEPLADTKSGYMHNGSGGLSIDRVVSLISVIRDPNQLAFYTYQAMENGAKGACCYISAS